MQSSNTWNLIFSVVELIVYLLAGDGPGGRVT